MCVCVCAPLCVCVCVCEFNLLSIDVLCKEYGLGMLLKCQLLNESMMLGYLSI